MILVFGGVTGGIGQPLHQALCGYYADQQVVMAIGRKHCDVELEASIAAFFTGEWLLQGPLHIINATGVSVSAMIHKTDIADMSRVLRVNLGSNILILKHAREIYKRHGGTFTMLGSVAATDGPVGTAVYAASKAALSGLARVASKEFALLNTRVNVIELGYTKYGMISQVTPKQLEELVKRLPAGSKWGTEQDVADACRFLIDCSYVTGATIRVAGGL